MDEKYEAIKNKFKSKSAQTVVDNLFLFLLITIVLLLILKSVELFAVVKNSRDSLERAALNVVAVNEYKLYSNFRENVIDDVVLGEFITTDEVIKVLADEYGLQKKSDGVYKVRSDNRGYYYKLTNITVNAVVEDNPNFDRYKIEASADLNIPINFMGFQDMEFTIDVSCIYASKLNAEH